MVDIPTPIVIPNVAQVEAVAKVDGVAILKFFGGLLGSGLTGLGGLVVSGVAVLLRQVTIPRIAIAGAVAGLIYGSSWLMKSEQFSKVTREVTTVSSELIAIKGELKETNEKLDRIVGALMFKKVPVTVERPPVVLPPVAPAPVKRTWFHKDAPTSP